MFLRALLPFFMHATCSVLLIRFFSVPILIVGLYRHFAYVGLPVPAGSHWLCGKFYDRLHSYSVTTCTGR
jgi:hypothetical protein